MRRVMILLLLTIIIVSARPVAALIEQFNIHIEDPDGDENIGNNVYLYALVLVHDKDDAGWLSEYQNLINALKTGNTTFEFSHINDIWFIDPTALDGVNKIVFADLDATVSQSSIFEVFYFITDYEKNTFVPLGNITYDPHYTEDFYDDVLFRLKYYVLASKGDMYGLAEEHDSFTVMSDLYSHDFHITYVNRKYCSSCYDTGYYPEFVTGVFTKMLYSYIVELWNDDAYSYVASIQDRAIYIYKINSAGSLYTLTSITTSDFISPLSVVRGTDGNFYIAVVSGTATSDKKIQVYVYDKSANTITLYRETPATGIGVVFYGYDYRYYKYDYPFANLHRKHFRNAIYRPLHDDFIYFDPVSGYFYYYSFATGRRIQFKVVQNSVKNALDTYEWKDYNLVLLNALEDVGILVYTTDNKLVLIPLALNFENVVEFMDAYDPDVANVTLSGTELHFKGTTETKLFVDVFSSTEIPVPEIPDTAVEVHIYDDSFFDVTDKYTLEAIFKNYKFTKSSFTIPADEYGNDINITLTITDQQGNSVVEYLNFVADGGKHVYKFFASELFAANVDSGETTEVDTSTKYYITLRDEENKLICDFNDIRITDENGEAVKYYIDDSDKCKIYIETDANETLPSLITVWKGYDKLMTVNTTHLVPNGTVALIDLDKAKEILIQTTVYVSISSDYSDSDRRTIFDNIDFDILIRGDLIYDGTLHEGQVVSIDKLRKYGFKVSLEAIDGDYDNHTYKMYSLSIIAPRSAFREGQIYTIYIKPVIRVHGLVLGDKVVLRGESVSFTYSKHDYIYTNAVNILITNDEELVKKISRDNNFSNLFTSASFWGVILLIAIVAIVMYLTKSEKITLSVGILLFIVMTLLGIFSTTILVLALILSAINIAGKLASTLTGGGGE